MFYFSTGAVYYFNTLRQRAVSHPCLPKSVPNIGPAASATFAPSPLSACELANFGADVLVPHLPLVSPIEWDAVGGELERLICRAPLQTGFVGLPRRHVRALQPRQL